MSTLALKPLAFKPLAFEAITAWALWNTCRCKEVPTELPESLAGGSAENVTIEELADFTINDLADIIIGEGVE